jgi:hypothetical protein
MDSIYAKSLLRACLDPDEVEEIEEIEEIGRASH